MERRSTSYPDEHYKQIAEIVLEFYADAGRVGGMNLAIAATYDVPATTAARWVRESRRRGFLPPSKMSGGPCPRCGQPGSEHRPVAEVRDTRDECIRLLLGQLGKQHANPDFPPR